MNYLFWWLNGRKSHNGKTEACFVVPAGRNQIKSFEHEQFTQIDLYLSFSANDGFKFPIIQKQSYNYGTVPRSERVVRDEHYHSWQLLLIVV
jgi:hypothetical protein